MTAKNTQKKKVIPNEERRSATRQKLLNATIEILRTEGIAALSTVSIAKKSGTAQSGFYMHFKDLDDCKRAAAEIIGGEFREFIARQRRKMYEINPDDLGLLKQHYLEILHIWNTERHLVEIFLRFRHDFSPLGKVMNDLLEQFQNDLAEDLEKLLAEKNLTVNRSRVKTVANLLIANISAIGETIIENKAANLEESAEILAAISQQTFYAALAENRQENFYI